jgi:uncharacterized protein YwqG
VSGSRAILGRTMVAEHDLRARLVAAGLGQRVEALVGLTMPSVRLRAQLVEVGELPVGTTKLGGLPELPPSWSWPRARGGPLSFVAQLNLAEVARLDRRYVEVLPAAGLLVFFFDAVGQWLGSDPGDRGGWQVRFIQPGTPLVRTHFPKDLPGDGRFGEVPLTAEPEVTVAPWESFVVAQIVPSLEEQLAYAAACVEVLGEHEDRVIHRLLGHPDPIHGDMQLECQLLSNGICYYGDHDADPRVRQLRPGAADWRLLLQVDSEDQAGMVWGDAGRIYYWVRTQDLRARRFDQAWLVLQCT